CPGDRSDAVLRATVSQAARDGTRTRWQRQHHHSRRPRPATGSPVNAAMVDRFLAHTGSELPVIGGPMYPCSNPELVAAVSASGGIGVVQPLALTYVHGHDYREGLRHIRSLTDGPIGMNALIEGSSRRYRARMEEWLRIAIEEGVRFFITSLGNPR